MTKHSIEVSKEVRDEYVRLKAEIKKVGGQEIDDDQVLGAMIGGFFDSLEYMKNHQHEHNHEHGHHNHDHDGCCGGHEDEDHECCGGKGDDCCCK